MEKARKISYICVTGLILVLVILICNITVEKRKMQIIHKTVTAQEYAELPMVNCHSEIDENGNTVYYVDADYPFVLIQPIPEEINCIELKFKYPLKDELSIGLYYQKDNEGFSDNQARYTGAKKNEESVTVHIPKGIYGSYMLSISGGEYSIDSLNYGIAEINGVSDDFSAINQYYKINWVGLAILILLLVILIIFEKKYGYFHAVKTILQHLSKKLRKIKPIKWIISKLLVCNDYREEDDIKARKTANTFAALALVFGCILIFLTPPMSNPDEIAHFENVCNISSFNIFLGKSFEGQAGLYLSPAEINFMEDNDEKYGIAFSGEDYSLSKINSFGNDYAYNDQVVFYPHYGSGINPMSYLSSSIGVIIFKLFINIENVYVLYIIAKVSNLIFSVICIRLAILKTPVLRNTMLLLALMPMTFFQICSVSYDVGAIVGSFLLFAYGTKLILADKTYRITVKDIFAVCFACACLFACKLLYIILALILFSISVKKFGNLKRYIISIGCVAITGLLFYYILTLLNNNAIGQNSIGFSNAELSKILLENWKLIPTIFWDTLCNKKGFYTTTFVGNLGWYSAPIPNVFVQLFVVLISIIITIEICSVRNFNNLARFLFGISSLSVIGGIIFSMYLGCGGFGTTVAEGVQGRYFIPVAIYIPLFLANPLLCKFKYAGQLQNSISFITKCTAAAYLLLTCAVIFTTYWM